MTQFNYQQRIMWQTILSERRLGWGLVCTRFTGDQPRYSRGEGQAWESYAVTLRSTPMIASADTQRAVNLEKYLVFDQNTIQWPLHPCVSQSTIGRVGSLASRLSAAEGTPGSSWQLKVLSQAAFSARQRPQPLWKDALQKKVHADSIAPIHPKDISRIWEK